MVPYITPIWYNYHKRIGEPDKNGEPIKNGELDKFGKPDKPGKLYGKKKHKRSDNVTKWYLPPAWASELTLPSSDSLGVQSWSPRVNVMILVLNRKGTNLGR